MRLKNAQVQTSFEQVRLRLLSQSDRDFDSFRDLPLLDPNLSIQNETLLNDEDLLEYWNDNHPALRPDLRRRADDWLIQFDGVDMRCVTVEDGARDDA